MQIQKGNAALRQKVLTPQCFVEPVPVILFFFSFSFTFLYFLIKTEKKLFRKAATESIGKWEFHYQKQAN